MATKKEAKPNKDGFIPGQLINEQEHLLYIAKQRLKEREKAKK